MKLVNKLSLVSLLVFSAIGLTGGLIFAHGCADISLLFSSAAAIDKHAFIPLIALSVLFLTALFLLLWIFYFIRHVVKTLSRVEGFVDAILSGNTPPPLPVEGIREDEIVSLFSTLNFMRDRQLNLAERLRCRIASEEKLRSEIEYCEDLQLAAFSKLLPEMRRSAGIIKAYTLIELTRVRQKNGDNVSLEEQTLLASLKRQSRLSREVDFISDIAKLERKTWSTPEIAPFSSAVLINELTDRCSVSLQARNIVFCSEYQSGLPEYLDGNKELVYQLLHLLIRSVSRSLPGGTQVNLSASGENGDAVFEIYDRRSDEHRECLAENYLQAFGNGKQTDFADCSLSILGLEIVRNIAEKTDCRFEVESSAEHLTLLRLRVPGSVQKNHAGISPLGFMRNNTSFSPAENDANTPLTVLMSASDSEEADAFKSLLEYSNINIICFPDNAALLQNTRNIKNVAGFIISAPFTQETPAQVLIPQLRRVGGSSFLPVLVIMPAYSKELALELAELPNVTGLVQPLNYAQAVNILRGTSAVKG